MLKLWRTLSSGGGLTLLVAVAGAMLAAWARLRAATQEAQQARREQRRLEDELAKLRERGLTARLHATAEAAEAVLAKVEEAERDRRQIQHDAQAQREALDRARSRKDFLEAIAARGLALILVALLSAAAPARSQDAAAPTRDITAGRIDAAPGRLTTWSAPPPAEAFHEAAGEAGWVVALDEVRLRHWLGVIDRGRAAEAELAAVRAERDHWRALAELRAGRVSAAEALLEEVSADRQRLRLEVAGLDRQQARRPKARRAWVIAGVVVGTVATLEILDP